MRKWYANWLKQRRKTRIDAITKRISEITFTINTSDFELWPEFVTDLAAERTRLAWKRSDLYNKLEGN
jgi:hypothetical protein